MDVPHVANEVALTGFGGLARLITHMENTTSSDHEFRSSQSRLIFSGTVSPIGGYSRRHPNHEATTVYRSLCLRGFVFRSRVSFKSFDDRLQESRLIFSGTVSPIGGYSRRHPNHEATTVYRSLCLRGFVVQ
ncbi:hypothetical protein HID58_005899, partial [Brassica napus]